MNGEMLAGLIGRHLRLRPLLRRFDWNGHELCPKDDRWQVLDVGSDGLYIKDIRTHHFLTVPLDRIEKLDPDGSFYGPEIQTDVLTLRGQAWLRWICAGLWPLDSPHRPRPYWP